MQDLSVVVTGGSTSMLADLSELADGTQTVAWIPTTYLRELISS
jgi:hypothetical protein